MWFLGLKATKLDCLLFIGWIMRGLSGGQWEAIKVVISVRINILKHSSSYWPTIILGTKCAKMFSFFMTQIWKNLAIKKKTLRLPNTKGNVCVQKLAKPTVTNTENHQSLLIYFSRFGLVVLVWLVWFGKFGLGVFHICLFCIFGLFCILSTLCIFLQIWLVFAFLNNLHYLHILHISHTLHSFIYS